MGNCLLPQQQTTNTATATNTADSQPQQSQQQEQKENNSPNINQNSTIIEKTPENNSQLSNKCVISIPFYLSLYLLSFFSLFF